MSFDTAFFGYNNVQALDSTIHVAILHGISQVYHSKKRHNTIFIIVIHKFSAIMSGYTFFRVIVSLIFPYALEPRIRYPQLICDTSRAPCTQLEPL